MKVRLQHAVPFQHYRNGRRALNEIKGLKQAVARGVVINLVIYFVLICALISGMYYWVHQPVENYLVQSVDAWYGPVLRFALWAGLIGFVLVLLLVSLRVSLKFMGLWHEHLVERVVEHHRGSEDSRFSIKTMVADFARTMVDVSKEIGLVLIIFVLGFIPLLGPIIVLAGTSWLLGRGLLDPYRSVCRARKEPLEIEGDHRIVLVALGVSELLLAIIPLIGWLILPVAVTLQVIGLTWTLEEERKASMATVTTDAI